MAQIVGSTPTAVQHRLEPWRPANGPLRRRRHLPIDGISRMTPVVASAARGITSTYLSGVAFAHSRSRARAWGPALPTWGWARPGMTGLLGTGPERCRSARPRVEARGRGVCRRNQAQRATDAPDTSCLPSGRSVSSATHEPPRTFAAEGPGATGGPSGISASDSTAAARAYGTG